MLTNNNAVYYPAPAFVKATNVGIGTPKKQRDTSTFQFVKNCVFFCVRSSPFYVNPKLDARNVMVGCAGASSDAPILCFGSSNPVQPATHSLEPVSGEVYYPQTENKYMSNNALNPSAISTSPSAVFLKDGKAITTSEHVAKIFKKEHYHVLRDIEKLDCSENFRKLNFELTFEIKQIGAVKRKAPFVEMTRDGFTFLCMGYTGKEAAQFKELYINRFNQMEKQLQEQNSKPDFEGRWVVKIEDGLPKTFSPIHPQAHIATPDEFAQRIANGFVSNTDVSVILQACVSHLTGQKITTERPVEKTPNPKDKVDLAKAFLNVVGQHGDRVRLAKELGIHTSTAQKVFSGLYRIANHEVYGDE